MQDHKKICIDALDWAKKRNYEGYSKFDALNSPLLRALSFNNSFLRKVYVFGISRFPVNIRPLLLASKKQNPKGLALFALAYLNVYSVTKNEAYKNEAVKLLDVLLGLSQKTKFHGHCFGYDHPWQNIAFYIRPYEPNAVVTCSAAKAFLKAYQITGEQKYLEIYESIADFILNDLSRIDVGDDMLCFSYDLRSPWKVINVNAFISAFFAALYKITQRQEHKDISQKIMRWVISQKTDYNAWYYTDPPGASRITHDNYHTGFVLDSIRDYLDVFGDDEIEKVWRDGLAFYKTELFTEDYAPKWMYNRKYPHDVHGSAQGIITFSRAGLYDDSSRQFADRILDWTIEKLYRSSANRFYYQVGKYWTKKFTLMRWCQAWMCYAISEYMTASKDER